MIQREKDGKKRTLKPNKNTSTLHTTYDFPMGPDNGK